MARLEEIERRLLNWARSKAGRSIGFAQSNPDNAGMPREPFADAPIPVTDAEANETDDAINTVLSSDQRLTVYAVYLGRGGDADRLRCLGCSRTTMHDRITVSHRLLAGHFTHLAERRRTERARVEALRDARR